MVRRFGASEAAAACRKDQREQLLPGFWPAALMCGAYGGIQPRDDWLSGEGGVGVGVGVKLVYAKYDIEGCKSKELNNYFF